MDDPNRNLEVSSEECSTNLYWTFGEAEIFNLQSTFRGNPTKEEMRSHLQSVVDGMKLIVDRGGHAKAIGSGKIETTAAKSNGNGNGYGFTSRKGKNYLVLVGNQPEPEEIDCPTHDGKKMKRRTNDNGSWYSHKHGDSYCSAGITREG